MKILIRKFDGICKSRFRPLSLRPPPSSAVGAAQFSPAREGRVKSGAQRRTLKSRESRRLPDAVRASQRFARVRRVAAAPRPLAVVTSRREERYKNDESQYPAAAKRGRLH